MEAVTDLTDGWAQQQQCAFAADCPVCHSTRPPPLPVYALKLYKRSNKISFLSFFL
jgi:hypothetical protein